MNMQDMDTYGWIHTKINECSFKIVIFCPLGLEAMLCRRSRNVVLTYKNKYATVLL